MQTRSRHVWRRPRPAPIRSFGGSLPCEKCWLRSQPICRALSRDAALNDIWPMPAGSLGLAIWVIPRRLCQCFPALDQIWVRRLTAGRCRCALLNVRVANELAVARVHHTGFCVNDFFRTQGRHANVGRPGYLHSLVLAAIVAQMAFAHHAHVIASGLRPKSGGPQSLLLFVEVIRRLDSSDDDLVWRYFKRQVPVQWAASLRTGRTG